ncbi:hypothetical protein BGX23_011480 [Mortierella sp. AD031]|nr:hypothetical protein BGX23_011480 [Mortierella sp. AD031]
MVQVRRFHSNVLFFIPLTQGVLLIIILDFCKNTVFFANQVQNLEPMVTTTLPDGSKGQSRKDPAYLTAQYVYAFWLLSMALKAIVGFRANLKFNLRWMGIYNVLFGMDTAFEFVHKTLGVIFQDMTALNDAEIIRHYTIGFLIVTADTMLRILLCLDAPEMGHVRDASLDERGSSDVVPKTNVPDGLLKIQSKRNSWC